MFKNKVKIKNPYNSIALPPYSKIIKGGSYLVAYSHSRLALCSIGFAELAGIHRNQFMRKYGFKVACIKIR